MEIKYNKEQEKKLFEKTKAKNLSKTVSFILTATLLTIFTRRFTDVNIYISIVLSIISLILFFMAFDNFLRYFLITSRKYVVERKRIKDIIKSKKEDNKNMKIQVEGDKKYYSVNLGKLEMGNEVDMIYSKDKKDVMMIIKKI